MDLSIDFGLIGNKLLSYWWLFLLGIIICVSIGQIYIRYSTPLYSSSAKFLITSVGNANNLSESKILGEGLGMEGFGKDMSNEIEILTSRPILTKVIKKINGGITFFSQGAIKHTEMYKTSPVVLDTFYLAKEEKYITFYVKMDYDQTFEFRIKEDIEGEVQTFGKPFKNEYGMFMISQDPDQVLNPGVYKVNIMDPEDVARGYKSALQVLVVGTQGTSSILELKLVDRSPEKAKDFINMLIEVYNEEEIEFNTLVLKNTIDFIDERIKELTSELNGIESGIERFKSENDIITPSANASLNYNLAELRSSLGKLSSYEIELELLVSLHESLSKNQDELIPVSLSGENASLTGLIGDYNALYLKRKSLSKEVSNKSDNIINLTTELNDIKGLIMVTLKNLMSNLQIPLAKTKKEINKLQKGLVNVPTVEKQLLEKLRMQTIKENLFLFLLQKKEETELSKAISTANTRIIESALSSRTPVYPQNKLIFIGSVLLGIFLPLFIIFGIQLIETRVDSEDVIKNLTTIPIIGRVSKIKEKEKIIIRSDERTIRSEMFRSLRTNLNFINHNLNHPIIAITSSSSGEGKSFTAINLGLTISFSGKKVIVLDMDLRKPKIAQYLNDDNSKGLTSYLTGKNQIAEIIKQHPENEHFSYITCGHIPPNPSELLMSDRVKILLDELKKDFDYIIIDTPPVGAVSDALLLRRYITNTLFVVRHKQTKKRMLRNIEELYKNDELINPSLIINGIKVDRKNSAYGGYSLMYGSDYYVNNNNG